MKKLRWITVLPITLGVISIFFGWTQSWEYAYDGTNDYMIIVRTVRTYVFIVVGFVLVIVGVLFGAVRKYVESLELKIYQLKQEIEKK
jgi:sensor histidine kinase YesM